MEELPRVDGQLDVDDIPSDELGSPPAAGPHPTPGWAKLLIALGVVLLAGQVVLGLLVQQRSTALDEAIAADGARLDGVDAQIGRVADLVGQLETRLSDLELTATGSSSPVPMLSAPTTTGLPLIPRGGPDPAVGMTLGSFTATDWRTGDEYTVENSEKAKVILVWAHWCPYCQQELPIMTGLVTSGALEAFPDVEFVSVTTFIDETRDNPLEPYLTEQQFDFPVLVDGDDSLATRMGVQAVPAWVVVNGSGVVLGRFTGAIPEEQVLGVFGEVQRLQAEG